MCYFLMFPAGCPVGKELALSGTCELCTVGTYKPDDSSDACTLCPFGFTTASTGATSREDCDVGQYTNSALLVL